MQRTDERKLTPLFCKNPMLCFAWTNRLHRFCYKIPASSSSSKASETRKPQKRLEDIWMCWKLLKACSSQIDDESWHVLKMKSRHEYRMDWSSLERWNWWRERLCRKSTPTSTWTISGVLLSLFDMHPKLTLNITFMDGMDRISRCRRVHAYVNPLNTFRQLAKLQKSPRWAGVVAEQM